ncbi:hypothetical protein JG687_00002228 [Phytophthora cactorum]|uniref:Uncharacterized protein n=1 Tax=Phytophthora cactorum TaxID=29920 RepID=A0A8T1UUZ5_9STRA|nr:hypothetical protein JG687_00002228 [Phytophthora cactorum]
METLSSDRDWMESVLSSQRHGSSDPLEQHPDLYTPSYAQAFRYRVDDADAELDNYIYQHTKYVHFCDDKLASIGITAEQLDAIHHLGAINIAASGVALQTSTSFFDMCVARFSILLFKNLTNTLDADTASILPELLKEALEAIEMDATHAWTLKSRWCRERRSVRSAEAELLLPLGRKESLLRSPHVY